MAEESNMVEDGRMSGDGGTQQNVGPSASNGSEGPVSPQAQQLADMMSMIRSTQIDKNTYKTYETHIARIQNKWKRINTYENAYKHMNTHTY